MATLQIPTDPVSAVSDAISETAQLIDDMSAKQYPKLYMWRIHTVIEHIVKECKKNKSLIPEHIVGAECFDLDEHERFFITNVVRERVGLSPIDGKDFFTTK